jgi:uncharacterized membrane protein
MLRWHWDGRGHQQPPTTRGGIIMELMFKIPVILVLVFIVFSLGQGMYYLAKDDGEEDKTRVVRALTVRIVLSLTLFGLLMLGYFTGLIQPHGV